MFEGIHNATAEGKEAAKKYAESSYKYFRLKIFQQLTVSIGLIVKLIIIGSLLSLGIIFCAIAGALILGDELGNMAHGYLAMAGIFFVISLIIYLFRKSIDRKILKEISKKFFN